MDYYGSLVENSGSGGGGGTVEIPIKTIKVNGVAQVPVNNTVDLTLPEQITLTQADYDALVTAGTVKAGVEYFISDSGVVYKDGVLYGVSEGTEVEYTSFNAYMDLATKDPDTVYICSEGFIFHKGFLVGRTSIESVDEAVKIDGVQFPCTITEFITNDAYTSMDYCIAVVDSQITDIPEAGGTLTCRVSNSGGSSICKFIGYNGVEYNVIKDGENYVFKKVLLEGDTDGSSKVYSTLAEIGITTATSTNFVLQKLVEISGAFNNRHQSTTTREWVFEGDNCAFEGDVNTTMLGDLPKVIDDGNAEGGTLLAKLALVDNTFNHDYGNHIEFYIEYLTQGKQFIGYSKLDYDSNMGYVTSLPSQVEWVDTTENGSTGSKVYTSLADLGLTAPVKVQAIVDAMELGSEARIDCFAGTALVSDLPEDGLYIGELVIAKYSNNYPEIKLQNGVELHLGTLDGDDVSWERVPISNDLPTLYTAIEDLGLTVPTTSYDIACNLTIGTDLELDARKVDITDLPVDGSLRMRHSESGLPVASLTTATEKYEGMMDWNNDTFVWRKVAFEGGSSSVITSLADLGLTAPVATITIANAMVVGDKVELTLDETQLTDMPGPGGTAVLSIHKYDSNRVNIQLQYEEMYYIALPLTSSVEWFKLIRDADLPIVYTDLNDLGYSGPCTTKDICQALEIGATYTAYITPSFVTDAPDAGVLCIQRHSTDSYQIDLVCAGNMVYKGVFLDEVGWTKLTEKVKDVAKTDLVYSTVNYYGDAVQTNNWYMVKNGVCYYSLYVSVAKVSSSWMPLISSAPKAVGDIMNTVASFNNASTDSKHLAYKIDTSGLIHFKDGVIGNTYLVSGSYPVAE